MSPDPATTRSRPMNPEAMKPRRAARDPPAARSLPTPNLRDLTAGKGYRMTAAGVPERLVEELRARATSVSTRDGFTHFQFTTREEVNDAVDRLRPARCPLESIVPTASTLEEVFVKTVEGKP